MPVPCRKLLSCIFHGSFRVFPHSWFIMRVMKLPNGPKLNFIFVHVCRAPRNTYPSQRYRSFLPHRQRIPTKWFGPVFRTSIGTTPAWWMWSDRRGGTRASAAFTRASHRTWSTSRPTFVWSSWSMRRALEIGDVSFLQPHLLSFFLSPISLYLFPYFLSPPCHSRARLLRTGIKNIFFRFFFFPSHNLYITFFLSESK